jgi:hypothetical protein
MCLHPSSSAAELKLGLVEVPHVRMLQLSALRMPPASPEIDVPTAMARHAPHCPEFEQ